MTTNRATGTNTEPTANTQAASAATSRFPEIKKNFGFGAMRLALKEREPGEAGYAEKSETATATTTAAADAAIDMDNLKAMVDMFMGAGFNYFDTAHGYLDGRSETALREALAARYPRDSYVLTDKLTGDYFRTAEDIPAFLREQLAACGVDYFDFYLLHSQHRNNYDHFKECRAYEIVPRLKEEGLIRHRGISFHDTAEMLDRILTENPGIEVVQIQLNYLDYAEGAPVDSRRVLEVCIKHDKPVIVMEPVKGGLLANLPAEAQAILDAAAKAKEGAEATAGAAKAKVAEGAGRGDEAAGKVASAEACAPACAGKGSEVASAASYAIRFAAGMPNVIMTLSGMANTEQMADNLSFMKEFKPLSEQERAAVDSVRRSLCTSDIIQCTGCRYCVTACPSHIDIPALFGCMNQKKSGMDRYASFYYEIITSGDGHGTAGDCIKCGKCERTCPQHLEIRNLLVDVSAEFDKAEQPEETEKSEINKTE